jgi:plastocyanin
MNTSTLIWILAAIVILVLGVFLFTGVNTEPMPIENEAVDAIMEEDTGPDEMMGDGAATTSEDGNGPETVVVTYTASGFSPASVTVNVGDTVRFVNEGNREMWIASDVHPTHERYSGTTRSEHCADLTATPFDQCERGASYSFMFDQAGTWGYHNHVQANHLGEVIVE